MQNLEGLSGISLQSLSIYLLLLMLATLRVGAFLVASPFFGSRMVPLTVRIVFSVALGVGLVNQLNFPDLAIMMGPNLVPIIAQGLLVSGGLYGNLVKVVVLVKIKCSEVFQSI